MAGKEYTTAPILVNSDGHPIPQYLDITDTTDSPQGTFKPLTQLQAEHPDVQNVQLTGSNVSKEYLQNVTVTAGSNVGTGNIDFSGTRIGVGIRLDRSAKFRVHGLSKRPGASSTVGVDLIIDRSENAASGYSESYVLKSTRYDIQVSNVDTTDFVVRFLVITDFLA